MAAPRLDLVSSDHEAWDDPAGADGAHLRHGVDLAARESFTDESFTDESFTDESFTDESFTDEELAQLALAADPEMPVEADAVPWSFNFGQVTTMLPQWYMPPAVTARTTRWRTALVIAIVVALVMIDAWGLCSTYGAVVPA
jgi:hypothetical protein